MAALQLFQQFFVDLGNGVHDLDVDDLRVYLSNDAPILATDKIKANVVEIGLGNGYTGPIPINAAFAIAGGVGTLTGDASETVTAAGGAIGPFRYVVLYNATKAGGPLIGVADYGSAITLGDTQTFTIQFGAVIMTIQVP